VSFFPVVANLVFSINRAAEVEVFGASPHGIDEDFANFI
jgi:hypothetical protein